MPEANYDEIWASICAQVKSYKEADEAQTTAFFSRLHLQAFAEGFAMFTADNAIIKRYVEQHYSGLILRALKDLYGTDFNIIIEVDEASASKTLDGAREGDSSSPSAPQNDNWGSAPQNDNWGSAPQNDRSASAPQGGNGVMPQPAIMSEAKDFANGGDSSSPSAPQNDNLGSAPQNDNLGSAPQDDSRGSGSAYSRMTFENYVVGSSNRMAYSMALSVAENPGVETLNPLFIYGKSGVGKTHLLLAIKNHLDTASNSGDGPLLKTVYVDSTEFVNDYADASADHSREKTSFRNFKKRYEDADVLIIDDVQTFQGKTETLKIIFELFNRLTSHGKQVVMSADIAPKNIDIDERYQTRFNSGGTFDIQAPEYETKESIVNSTVREFQQTNNRDDLDIPQNVRQYVAEISSSNIRELKSAVFVLFQHMIVSGETTMSVDEAAKILENHFSNSIKRLSIADIQKAVESFYKVSHADLVGSGRKHSIAYPRQVAMYLCRQLIEETFVSIGQAFGGKDHSTVKYSVDLVSQRIKEDKEVKEEIDIIIKEIRNR